MKRLVVTIDGPAGAGKSTAARRLAQELGYQLLDTGAIYRTVALLAQRAGVPFSDAAPLADIARGLDIDFRFEDGQNRVFVGGRDVSADIRTPAISQGSSQVSAHPAVRAALLDLQRRLGAGGGVVVEGRDVGTVVFPNAEAKFFLTASPEVRAQRRFEELGGAAAGHDAAQTLQEIAERDRRDETRQTAPLKQAPDAVLVDSSAQTMDDVVATLVAEVRKRAQLSVDKGSGGS
jgi:CMP/dCMP kinase